MFSKEPLQPHQMTNMPDTSPVIPKIVPDPAGIQWKLSLAEGTGHNHGRRLELVWIICLREMGYCKK